MTINQIVDRLKEKPYLISMGAKSVANILKCTPEDVYKSREIIKQEKQNNPSHKPKPKKGKLKSRWQNSAGKWLESYKFDNKEPEIDIEAIIKKVISNIQSVPVKIPEKVSDFNFNLYLSDQHIGASVNHALYANYFDKDIYERRMGKILTNVIGSSLFYNHFKSLNIFFLGDTFDGQDGFTVKRTHKLPQNMSNEEAFETGFRINLEFLESIISAGIAEKYNIYFVRQSNHGGSMDYYLFKSLGAIINVKYSSASSYIADRFIGKALIGNHTFLYTHGKDNEDMTKGLPLNLDKTTESFINQFIDYYNISGYIHLIKGDLHQNNTNYGKKFRYKNVPSIFGSSKWIMANYGYTAPACSYDVFTDNKKEITEGIIYL